MDSMSRCKAVLRTGFAQQILAGTKRCPSIPKSRWLDATDSLRSIGSHIPEIRNLIMVCLEDEEEEIQRVRRNPVFDIVREGDDAERFQLMEDCLSLLQLLRLLCD
jgi:hypothetical protein